MTQDARLKLELRLSPPDGTPDPVILDDLIRLVRQGVVTAPEQAPRIVDAGESRPPETETERAVPDAIRERIQKASTDSQALADTRAARAAVPGSGPQLAAEARRAAENVVAAVRRAISSGIQVRVPPPPPPDPAR